MLLSQCVHGDAVRAQVEPATFDHNSGPTAAAVSATAAQQPEGIWDIERYTEYRLIREKIGFC